MSQIPKKGDLHDIKNYRPVLILNIIAKISENTIHDYLYKALNSVIDSHQHGFMTRRSTVTNINDLMSFVAPKGGE